MPRGIINSSGVACHISCALQLLAHVLLPLRRALHASKPIGMWSLLANFLEELATNSDDHGCSLEPLDPTILYRALEESSMRWNPNDVGDAGTALYQLLQLLQSHDDPSLKSLVHLCVLSGISRQVLEGERNNVETQERILRMKEGKCKAMACPYPLVGTFKSLEEALELAITPRPIRNYNWSKLETMSYKEQVTTMVDSADCMPTSSAGWKTARSIRFEQVPNYWVLSLERFTYDHQGVKVLSNAHVSLPLTLNSSKYSKDEAMLHLEGGVLHVSEESVEEEGHYVTILREDTGRWVLVDDEQCSVLDQDFALTLLEGGKDESGKFYCATMVVYTKESMKDSEEMRRLVHLIQDGAQMKLDQQLSLVGRRLKVKWTKEKFYPGVIESYDPSNGKHRVRYDDGDIKDYILENKTIEWLDCKQ